MSDVYRFPRTKFVDENPIESQLGHLCSETAEAVNGRDDFHRAEELMDVIHSAETALRIIEKDTDLCLEDIMAGVIEKNKRRGYYRCV